MTARRLRALLTVPVAAGALGFSFGCATRDQGSESNFVRCEQDSDCLRQGTAYACVDGLCTVGPLPDATTKRVAEDAGGGPATGACASDGGWSPLEPRFCTLVPGQPSVSTARNSVSGRIVGLEPNRMGEGCAGLSGVEVCLFQTATCATSDADGAYVLEGLPPGDQEITFTKEGYDPLLHQVMLGAPVDLGPVLVLTPTALGNRYAACARAAGDGRYGTLRIAVGVTGPPDSTANTIALSPSLGSGPHYLSSGPDPVHLLGLDPNLAALSSESGVAARAYWFDVPPGDYAVHWAAKQPARDLTPFCFPLAGTGWKTSTDGVPRVRVRAGYLTDSLVYCVNQGQ